MADKLQVNTGDFVHLRGESGSFCTGVVMDPTPDKLGVIITSEGQGFGLIQLRWDRDVYRSVPTDKAVQVDRPVLVKARLRKLKTDDGIMELIEEHCWIGKEYTVDIASVHDVDWQHIRHPGKTWKRPSAYVYREEDESDGGIMPVELFDIEYV